MIYILLLGNFLAGILLFLIVDYFPSKRRKKIDEEKKKELDEMIFKSDAIVNETNENVCKLKKAIKELIEEEEKI